MLADDPGRIQVMETLNVKIYELKNLPPRSSTSPKSRSTYCTVNLDQEQIYSTTTVKNSFNPYFGAEYGFEIPRPFRYLNIYIFDKNESLTAVNGANGNGALGKVALAKNDLHKYSGKDHWLPIVPVDANSEVRGKLLLEINHVGKELTIKLKEGSELSVSQKRDCDPFTLISLEYPEGSKNKAINRDQYPVYQTKTLKKTATPQFDESCSFNVEDLNLSELEVKFSVWHESTGVWGNVFLGEVRVPLANNFNGTKKHKAWWYLQPRSLESRDEVSAKGSVRLFIRYSSEIIIPDVYYEPLRLMLGKVPKSGSVTASAAFLLGEICEDKTSAAIPLVRVLLKTGRLLKVIRELAKLEMDTILDVHTLFRGNSLLSKCVDELMKLTGKFYLKSFLKEHIDKIYEESRNCEIDPAKLENAVDRAGNLKALMNYTSNILNSLTSSALNCPSVISDVLSELRNSAMQRYPDRTEIQYSVVAGFILLRLVAPAILSPESFGLRNDGGKSDNVTRTLTLVSKAVQSVGNVLSNSTEQVRFKEPYMTEMHVKFGYDPYLKEMKMFLDTVSSSNVIRSFVPAELLKGFLKKRVIHPPSLFGRRSTKRRYFKLTMEELSYGKDPSSASHHIPVGEIESVAYLKNGDSLDFRDVFEISASDRHLCLQAANSVEAKEWMDALRFVLSRRSARSSSLVPSSGYSGGYTGEKSLERAMGGATVDKVKDLPVNINVTREMEKVHCLLLKNMDKLNKLHENCKQHLTSADSLRHLEAKCRMDTIDELIDCVTRLEQEHRHQIKQAYQHNLYGSEFAPIGEEIVVRPKGPFYIYPELFVSSESFAVPPSPATRH